MYFYLGRVRMNLVEQYRAATEDPGRRDQLRQQMAEVDRQRNSLYRAARQKLLVRIGVADPSQAQPQAIRQALLDIWGLNKPFSVFGRRREGLSLEGDVRSGVIRELEAQLRETERPSAYVPVIRVRGTGSVPQSAAQESGTEQEVTAARPVAPRFPAFGNGSSRLPSSLPGGSGFLSSLLPLVFGQHGAGRQEAEEPVAAPQERRRQEYREMKAREAARKRPPRRAQAAPQARPLDQPRRSSEKARIERLVGRGFTEREAEEIVSRNRGTRSLDADRSRELELEYRRRGLVSAPRGLQSIRNFGLSRV